MTILLIPTRALIATATLSFITLTIIIPLTCPPTGGKLYTLILDTTDTTEYQQEDPLVVEDIQKGNVVWKPKDEWPRLEEAMRLAEIARSTV